MKIKFFEVNGHTYMDKNAFADSICVSEKTAKKYIREIEEEMLEGTYKKYAVIRLGKILAVNTLVAVHYLTYASYLKEKNTRKLVPSFNAKEVREFMGMDRILSLEPHFKVQEA